MTDVRAAAERLLREVNLHREGGAPEDHPTFSGDIEMVVAFVLRSENADLAERDERIAALEAALRQVDHETSLGICVMGSKAKDTYIRRIGLITLRVLASEDRQPAADHAAHGDEA